MNSPQEIEFFPLKPSKSMETLQLFDEGPSSMITSTEEEQHELEPVIERYKGVVLQQNGNWGAQIYVNQSRIWLGTFKSEIAAACAYDSAAIKLNHGDSHRNFPWNEVTINEPGYQEHFTNAAILEMIRDGSYETKFIDFVRAIQSSNTGGGGGAGASALEAAPVVLMEGITCTQMFQKELTPSDVGKLNRLVIPKKHATRYLPAVTADTVEEVLLNFHDRMNRIWVFRYCYWRSSQSYVFTKGWNKFVKEIDLKARDTIVFYRCQEKVGLSLIRTFCMIDIIRSVGIISGAAADNPVEDVEVAENPTGSDEEDGKSKHLMEEDDSREVKKETKLFGVWIR